MSTTNSTPEPQGSEAYTLSPTDAADTTDATASTAGARDDEQTHKPRLLIQKTHAAFVSKLYAMVADQKTDRLISWTEDGDCFQVTDPNELSREVLPAYFKHGNWQSFVRQLNMYGFHKVNDLAYGGIFGDTQIWMFKHEYFLRGEVKLLLKIKRRGPKSSSAASASTSAEADVQSPETAPPISTSTPTSTSAPIAASAISGTSPTAHRHQQQHGDGLVLYGSSSTAMESTGELIRRLEDRISSLEHSHSMLLCENRHFRAAQKQCQDGFFGFLDFLNTAVVNPSTAVPYGSPTGHSRINEAFTQLVEATRPFMSLPPSQQTPPAPQSAASMPSTGPPDSASYCLQHRQQHPEPRFAPARPTTLPPIRPRAGPQSEYVPRVPSLSPPAKLGSILPRSDTLPYHLGKEDSASTRTSRKRRSISSSSSNDSSNDSSSEAAEHHPSLPSVLHIALPPISGVIQSMPHDMHSHDVHLKPPARWCPPCPSKASVQSLRETLPPAKKPRAIE